MYFSCSCGSFPTFSVCETFEDDSGTDRIEISVYQPYVTLLESDLESKVLNGDVETGSLVFLEETAETNRLLFLK